MRTGRDNQDKRDNRDAFVAEVPCVPFVSGRVEANMRQNQ